LRRRERDFLGFPKIGKEFDWKFFFFLVGSRYLPPNILPGRIRPPFDRDIRPYFCQIVYMLGFESLQLCFACRYNRIQPCSIQPFNLILNHETLVSKISITLVKIAKMEARGFLSVFVVMPVDNANSVRRLEGIA